MGIARFSFLEDSMPIRSQSAWIRKWQSGMSGAGQTALESVNAMTEAPSQGAVAMKSQMRTNWLKSLDDGTWEAGMLAFGLAEYKEAMKTKGIPHMTEAASRADVQRRQAAYVAAAHSTYQQLSDQSRAERREGVNGDQRLLNNKRRMQELRGRFRQK